MLKHLSLKVLCCLFLFILWAVPVFAQNPDTIPFAPAVNYSAGNNPLSVFCADLDRDDDLDLAVANALSDNVSILENNGDGTFQSPVNYGVGDNPISVFCANLDGDSDLDLAIANHYSNTVSVLMNNGNGTFQPKVDYLVGYEPVGLACSDLDGDGDLDLAVAVAGIDSICILENDGNGIFQSPVYYSAGDCPSSVCCADFDKDGDLDLAVSNYYSNTVSIFNNNGNGTFQSKVDYNTGNGPQSVAFGNLDGDGDFDLATANVYGGDVSILKNNGDGTFQAKVDYPAGDGAWSIFCADLDRDGNLDVVTANAAGNGQDSVSILRNKGDGTFQSSVNYAVGSAPRSVFCADLDKDGDLDIATANQYSSNVSILKNLTNPLVGYWKFDEDAGTIAYDSSGYGNDGALMNGPVWVDGLPLLDKALDFDGTDDYVDCGDRPSLNLTVDLTISMWVRFNILPGDMICFVSKDEGPNPHYKWEFGYATNYAGISNALEFHINNPDGIGVWLRSSYWIPSIGQWYHIAVVGSNNNYTFYVNDSNYGEDTTTYPPPSVNAPVEIGRAEGASYFNGVIDQVKIYSRALSPEEIKAEFEAGFIRGDANADGVIDVGDVVYLINYLFKGGLAPNPLAAGDATCDGAVDVGDVVYLINYLFRGGQPPSC